MIYSLITTVTLFVTIAGLVAWVRALLAFFRLFGSNIKSLRDGQRPSLESEISKVQDRGSALKGMGFFVLEIGVSAALLLFRNWLIPIP